MKSSPIQLHHVLPKQKRGKLLQALGADSMNQPIPRERLKMPETRRVPEMRNIFVTMMAVKIRKNISNGREDGTSRFSFW